MLVDENGLVFWDSTLIVEYLDDTYPEPAFYPSERIERLRCRQGEELADTLIDKVVALWYETRKGDNAQAAVQAHHQGNIDRLMAALEKQLGVTRHLLNDQFTAVDVATVSGLSYYSLRFGKTWQSNFPRLAQWFGQQSEYCSKLKQALVRRPEPFGAKRYEYCEDSEGVDRPLTKWAAPSSPHSIRFHAKYQADHPAPPGCLAGIQTFHPNQSGKTHPLIQRPNH